MIERPVGVYMRSVGIILNAATVVCVMLLLPVSEEVEMIHFTGFTLIRVCVKFFAQIIALTTPFPYLFFLTPFFRFTCSSFLFFIRAVND